ncbi:MAG: hypothetical protein ABIK31_02895 [candidate division WOR-3 bacterium]
MANQVHPISSALGTGSGVKNFVNPVPDSVVTIISCAVRFGPQHRLHPIGLVQSIAFDTKRDVEEYYEITSYPSPKFGSIDALFNEMSFNDSIAFDGEPAALFPGVVSPVEVFVERPMLFSSNLLEAVFKISGSGEFTTGTETDFRYRGSMDSSGNENKPEKVIKDTVKRGLIGAGLGAASGLLRPQRPGQSGFDSVLEGALGGALSALMPRTEYVPEKTRYGSLLQQVRPLEMSFLVYSPTLPNKVVYGLHFINGWSTSWKIDRISASSQVLLESLSIKFERVRVIKEV